MAGFPGRAYTKGFGGQHELGCDSESFDDMRGQLEEHIDFDTHTVDDDFYDLVNKYANGHEDDFCKKLNPDGSDNAYSNSYDSNYKYDWRGMLNLLGY